MLLILQIVVFLYPLRWCEEWRMLCNMVLWDFYFSPSIHGIVKLVKVRINLTCASYLRNQCIQNFVRNLYESNHLEDQEGDRG